MIVGETILKHPAVCSSYRSSYPFLDSQKVPLGHKWLRLLDCESSHVPRSQNSGTLGVTAQLHHQALFDSGPQDFMVNQSSLNSFNGFLKLGYPLVN